MFPTSPRDGGLPGHGNVWSVFAALYLVVFAFFILLVSASRPDAQKSVALVEGLRTAFSSDAGLDDDDALFVAGRSALAELAGDLQGVLRIARVNHARRGEELRLTLAEVDLFDTGSAEPSVAAMPLIDRVVTALDAPPPGLRLAMTLTMPEGRSSPLAPNGVAIDQPLSQAARRAAGFAAVLVARGASPTTITVGVAERRAPEVLLVFRFHRAAAGG